MQTIASVAALRKALCEVRAQGRTIALVPTMGNLHAGHLSLVDIATRHADFVVTSVFVNPTQFGPGEDYASYPRTLDEDRKLLAEHGCDLMFAPDADEMYPEGAEVGVQFYFPGLEGILCAVQRPGHFNGVARVVSKLFHIVNPQLAVFGEKDYQQLLVVRRLVKQLSFPVRIMAGKIVRDADGLAMSSRNRYLTKPQRQSALYIPRGLQQLPLWYQDDPENACTKLIGFLSAQGLRVDYAEVRDATDLQAVGPNSRQLVGLVAARIGKTRLLDNILFAKNIA